MSSSLEGNKIAAAVLTAGVIAMTSGFLAHLLYGPEELTENTYIIEVTDTSAVEAEGLEAHEEPLAVRLAAGDVAAGEKQAKKCAACHTFEKGGADKIGPNLWEIVDDGIANNAGFAYSDSLAGRSDENWTYENLDAFLADPKGWAPGTKMSFAGISNSSARADLILYLRSLSENPADLPEAEISEEAAEVTAEDIQADAAEGDAAEGDAAEGDAAEGDAAEGDAAEGDAAEGDAAEGDAAEGDAAEGDAAEGDAAEGDDVQGSEAESGEAQSAEAAAPAANGLGAALAAADPEAGEKQAKKCTACHTVDEGGANKIGPNLWDIVNRPIAGVDGFSYSKALSEMSGEVWDFANLDGFLADPKGWAKGTKMSFAGIKKEGQRADLLVYLRSLSNDPAPLPE